MIIVKWFHFSLPYAMAKPEIQVLGLSTYDLTTFLVIFLLITFETLQIHVLLAMQINIRHI